MQALLQQFFDFAIMARALPLLLTGLGQTLVLCLVVIPLGLIGGLLVALTSLARSRAVRWSAAAAIDFFRAIPPLVLLIFVYAGLPFAGIRLSPLAAVAIAFLLNNSSYYGEIYRAGIESVGHGQWDAARSTGPRQRCRAAGTAVFGRHGAVDYLQHLADRARGGDLPGHAVADRASGEPARAADRVVSRSGQGRSF